MLRARPARPLLVLAGVLTVLGVWWAVDNPDIDGTSRGDHYTCLAPYDTVLAGADNVPGGEPPPDSEEIAARCRHAGRQRFTLATGLLGTAALAVVGVVVLDARGRRTRSFAPHG